jgi:hypothetical protein
MVNNAMTTANRQRKALDVNMRISGLFCQSMHPAFCAVVGTHLDVREPQEASVQYSSSDRAEDAGMRGVSEGDGSSADGRRRKFRTAALQPLPLLPQGGCGGRTGWTAIARRDSTHDAPDGCRPSNGADVVPSSEGLPVMCDGPGSQLSRETGWEWRCGCGAPSWGPDERKRRCVSDGTSVRLSEPSDTAPRPQESDMPESLLTCTVEAFVVREASGGIGAKSYESDMSDALPTGSSESSEAQRVGNVPWPQRMGLPMWD